MASTLHRITLQPSTLCLTDFRVVALTLHPSRVSSIRSPSNPLLDGSIPADNTVRLETLKRQLLRDSDWAAVSAARPLEITFASPQEAEHFGKRRRLTAGDQKRLSDDHGNRPTLAFPKEHYWRESRDTGTALDQIEIKITGQPWSQLSKDRKGSHRGAHGSANHDFLQSPRLSRPRLSTNAQNLPSSMSDHRVSQAPNSTRSTIPRRRHFETEEHELEEQITRNPLWSNSVPPQELSCNPTETLPASPALIPTDSLSNGTQSWLPQPAHRPFPSSPLLHRSEATKIPGIASHMPGFSQNSSDPYIRRIEEDCPTAPVKIFGQLVRMRGSHDSTEPL